MADPSVIFKDGKYYAVAPSKDWQWLGEGGANLGTSAPGQEFHDLADWTDQNMPGMRIGRVPVKHMGFTAIPLSGIGDYPGPVSVEGPVSKPGVPGVSQSQPQHATPQQAEAWAIQNKLGVKNKDWYIGLGDQGYPMAIVIPPQTSKPPASARLIGHTDLPGTGMRVFMYADGTRSAPIRRAEEEEPGVGSDTLSAALWKAVDMQVASSPVEGGPPVLAPGYVLAVDTDPSSKTFQKWVVRTASSMTAAEIANARRMSDDQLAMAQTQDELTRMQAMRASDIPLGGGVSSQGQPIYDERGNVIQYAIQEYDAQGNLTTKYVKASEPAAMEAPARVVTTPQGMYQYSDNEWSPLGMSEQPATLEMQGGMLWMRDQKGGLNPVNNVLERMIEQKIIEGDWDAALQWDDFRNRPSPQEHLQSMLDYARTPADQMLLSAIARGYEQGAVPPNAGELGRVGPVPAEQREAWERYQRSVTGTGSEMSEMQAFLQEESAERTRQQELRQEEDDARWKGLSETIGTMQEETASMMNSVSTAISDAMSDFTSSVNGGRDGGAQDYMGDLTGSGLDWNPDTNKYEVIGGDGGLGDGGLGGDDPDLDHLGIPIYGSDWERSKAAFPSINKATWEYVGGGDLTAGGVGGAPPTAEDLAGMNSADARQAIEDFWERKSKQLNANMAMAINANTEASAANPEGFVKFLRPREGQVWDEKNFKFVEEGLEQRLAEERAEREQQQQLELERQEQEQRQQLELERQRQVDIDRQSLSTTTVGTPGHVLGSTPLSSQRSRTQRESGAYVASSDAPVINPATGTRRRPSSTVSEMSTWTNDLLRNNLSASDKANFYASLASSGGYDLGYETAGIRAPVQITDSQRQDIGSKWAKGGGEILSEEERAAYAGVSPDNIDLWDYAELAEGGIVQGPTIALLGEKEPEVVIPLSKLPKMAEGGIVFSSAEQQPVGIQELLAGRSPRPLGGRLLNQAGMTLPSAQSWRNLSSDEQEIYGDLGARAGITSGYMQSELESARPSGGRGAGQASMLPLATRRIFR